jgi:hypothetical protein
VEHGGQQGALATQQQLALADAAAVEQVVHQPHHLAELALHRRPRALDGHAVVAGQLHDLEPVAQRRQRVAEFVRERREELVLQAIGFAQGLGLHLPVSDVDGDAIEPDRAIVLVGGSADGSNPSLAPIRTERAVLDVVRRVPGDGLIDGRSCALAILRMQAVVERLDGDTGIRRQTKMFLDLAVPDQLVEGQVAIPQPDLARIDDHVESFFGTLAVVDVDDRSGEPEKRAVDGHARPPGIEHPAIAAIGRT